ncbi:MAG: hypothetical protein KC766_12040 [Myxococcales bacterium]|nr:hypothetical protein [Myxococcales bacterium]
MGFTQLQHTRRDRFLLNLRSQRNGDLMPRRRAAASLDIGFAPVRNSAALALALGARFKRLRAPAPKKSTGCPEPAVDSVVDHKKAFLSPKNPHPPAPKPVGSRPKAEENVRV